MKYQKVLSSCFHDALTLLKTEYAEKTRNFLLATIQDAYVYVYYTVKSLLMHEKHKEQPNGY